MAEERKRLELEQAQYGNAENGAFEALQDDQITNDDGEQQSEDSGVSSFLDRFFAPSAASRRR